ncbi:putative large-conductance mechanosensitive channel [Podospora fimiseda]|uniref:Large-conductance mechanosensitive channel n=1 Tax=Podospora fimiseda TaxID=252190 RepID=A0AAN7BNX5_9PEZI|nr:putative large-conductance mechanosensitive channel [Podospora fimiseda]
MPHLTPGPSGTYASTPSTQDDSDIDDTQELLLRSRHHARRFFTGFLDFAFKGNVLEIAFGLILASMFTAVVTSLMTDILLPPLSVILPLNKNLEEKFAVLQSGESGKGAVYNTLKQAQEDGAVVMAYGVFLNRVLNFVGVGFVLYGMAWGYQLASKDPIIKRTVKCRYCRKEINEKARRCVECTSWQDGREDRHF